MAMRRSLHGLSCAFAHLTVAPFVPTMSAHPRYPALPKASLRGRRSGDRGRRLRTNLSALVSTRPVAHRARSWHAFLLSPRACSAVRLAAPPLARPPLRFDAANLSLHAPHCGQLDRVPDLAQTPG